MMASKTPHQNMTGKRGPYQRESRTTKWRKRTHDSSQIIDEADVGEAGSDIDEFDKMVNDILEAELSSCSSEQIPNSRGDQPLYAGCRLTASMSMLLIITFAMRHSLTGVALCDLLVLVELHCMSNNLCRSTLKLYRDCFQNLKNPIVFNFYCQDCFLNFGVNDHGNCPNCSSSRSSHFLTVPTVKQLTSILNRPGIFKAIQKKKQSPKYLDSMKDITDGKLYREHFDESGYLRGISEKDRRENELHISLQVNTDGVAIFKSSKFSVWPVYATINELPPNLR